MAQITSKQTAKTDLYNDTRPARERTTILETRAGKRLSKRSEMATIRAEKPRDVYKWLCVVRGSIVGSIGSKYNVRREYVVEVPDLDSVNMAAITCAHTDGLEHVMVMKRHRLDPPADPIVLRHSRNAI